MENRTSRTAFTDEKILAFLSEGLITVDDPEFGARARALIVREYYNDY